MTDKAKIKNENKESDENGPLINNSQWNPCYIYAPKIEKPQAKPIKRRQGLSRPDGYYFHENTAAAGLYWVLQALCSIPLKERFPVILKSDNMRRERAALVLQLAENLTWEIFVHSRKVHSYVRHQETLELIHRLESSGNTQARSAAADLAKAEAALSSSMMEYPGDERTAHLYWLNPDDEPALRKLIKDSNLDVSNAGAASKHARKLVGDLYPKAVQYAKSQANQFSLHHKNMKRFELSKNEELCRLRPDYCQLGSLNKLIRGGLLGDSSPVWAHKYTSKIEEVWRKEKLAWEKSVFRLIEPGTRTESFNSFNADKNRFTPGKNYLMWLSDHGRYHGMLAANHNRLLTEAGKIDKKSKSLILKLDLNPPAKGLSRTTAVWLRQFTEYAQTGRKSLNIMG